MLDFTKPLAASAKAASTRRPCPECGERWIEVEWPGGGTKRVPVLCSHQEAEYQRLADERERQNAYQARAAVLGRILPPRAYRNVLLADVRESAGNRNGLSAARQYVATWAERKAQGDGLIFSGECGTNKTLIACAIANELERQFFLPVVLTVPELIDELRDFRATEDLAGICKRCDLLVLDELGTEKVTEWAAAELFSIVDARYRERRPTVVTTNLNIEDLEAKWIRNLSDGRDAMPPDQANLTVQRVLSRFKERCAAVLFDGPDQRGRARHSWLVLDGELQS